MNNARELHAMFPAAVQITEIAGAEPLNVELVAEIDRIRASVPNSLPEAWSCNLYTTIRSGLNLFDRPSFVKLRGHIMTEVGAFAASYGFDSQKFPPRITECWVNVYGQGDSQEAHIHQNNVISGIYYVAAPPGCGELLFHSPHSDSMLEPPLREVNNINLPVRAMKPAAGTMVLFRSWLRHSVKPTVGQENRISIAFNLTM
ncbi:MAG: TIGR02466 family protein [Proteobacteria bacterium]|nr:TIGR02466 family protein [Pseudomonadota bacterium]